MYYEVLYRFTQGVPMFFTITGVITLIAIALAIATQVRQGVRK